MAGHVGGCIGGFLVGLVAGLPGLPGTARESFWKAAAGVAVLITIYAWLQAFRFFLEAFRAMTST
ncbi:MAG TPA: hypothetical protein VK604_04665 [Bryobacteraceae bacterium]|nr:hypothetical protein [Bryobacteraceae bacterium]